MAVSAGPLSLPLSAAAARQLLRVKPAAAAAAHRAGRPHATYVAVSSVDGRIGFDAAAAPEFQSSPGPAVAMASRRGYSSGAECDRRLMHAGWALTDAVLGSGAVLRAEPAVTWLPADRDLQLLRRRGRRAALCREWPLRVVLTASGDVSPEHPVLGDGVAPTVAFAPPQGAARLAERCGVAVPEVGAAARVPGAGAGLVLHCVPSASSGGGAHLGAVMWALRAEYGVRSLEVLAGGTLAAALLARGLLDELRVTLAAQVIGGTGPQLLGPMSGFTPQTAPGLRLTHIHWCGGGHLFVRAAVRREQMPRGDQPDAA
eukprot:TRINITY_DN40648_c0_g1_i1.p1 TRINITY_DN40648_c0_g1~~TRINITY_DN40648_c0_g1_i1.p1  ORF type:complete len:338 (+),score=78.63 TRINITY_DN40648_c0_g1_i1:67-1014(+)